VGRVWYCRIRETVKKREKTEKTYWQGKGENRKQRKQGAVMSGRAIT
jgi:hypothetical protein